MAQPIKKKILSSSSIKKNTKNPSQAKKKRKHKEYGTSKLEKRFAKNFLDALGIDYVYQFKAESIGRYFDYAIPDIRVLIEVDGDYYHSRGLVYEEMSPMQKKNRRVDEHKNHWALVNGYKLYRIWEHDINNNPEKVMKFLKKLIKEHTLLQEKINEKKKRH